MEDTKNQRLSRYNPVPPERKAEIIDDALVRIENETLEQIASSHGISKQALNGWLSALGDEYQEHRQRIVDNQLLAAEEQVREAGKKEQEEGNVPSGQLSLARAREVLRHAQWIAERRDNRYASKPTVQIGIGIQGDAGFVSSAGELLDQYLPKK